MLFQQHPKATSRKVKLNLKFLVSAAGVKEINLVVVLIANGPTKLLKSMEEESMQRLSVAIVNLLLIRTILESIFRKAGVQV